MIGHHGIRLLASTIPSQSAAIASVMRAPAGKITSCILTFVLFGIEPVLSSWASGSRVFVSYSATPGLRPTGPVVPQLYNPLDRQTYFQPVSPAESFVIDTLAGNPLVVPGIHASLVISPMADLSRIHHTLNAIGPQLDAESIPTSLERSPLLVVAASPVPAAHAASDNWLAAWHLWTPSPAFLRLSMLVHQPLPDRYFDGSDGTVGDSDKLPVFRDPWYPYLRPSQPKNRENTFPRMVHGNGPRTSKAQPSPPLPTRTQFLGILHDVYALKPLEDSQRALLQGFAGLASAHKDVPMLARLALLSYHDPGTHVILLKALKALQAYLLVGNTPEVEVGFNAQDALATIERQKIPPREPTTDKQIEEKRDWERARKDMAQMIRSEFMKYGLLD